MSGINSFFRFGNKIFNRQHIASIAKNNQSITITLANVNSNSGIFIWGSGGFGSNIDHHFNYESEIDTDHRFIQLSGMLIDSNDILKQIDKDVQTMLMIKQDKNDYKEEIKKLSEEHNGYKLVTK